MTVITEIDDTEVKMGHALPLKSVEIIMDYREIINGLRSVFKSGRTLSYGYRIEQLKNLQRFIAECTAQLTDALYKDLRKPKMEASSEIISADIELSEAIRCLQKWMTPEKLPNNLLFPSDRAFIKPEPFGVALIIGAWNYPVALTICPLIGAIAAGNCGIIKPSELAPCTSAKILELLPKYLDPLCYRVVEGSVKETTELLKQKFDYIFSTSSTAIGKVIMAAAATNLTPVTLELGGKSPVYIHDSADLEVSAKRILWGKLTNMGQTCIAPDYIICSKKVQDYFVSITKSILEEWYGENLMESSDISRIINLNHFNRLKRLLMETKGKVVFGGETDSSDLWISPTLVVDVDDSDVLMEEEIFGPILPFVRADNAHEAMNYLNNKNAKPLALYLFSQDQAVNKLFLERTSSGGFSINEVVLHCGWQGLPFGGVQESGIGSYHGKYSFDCFSHRKGVLARDFSYVTEKLSAIRYPPYESTDLKVQFVSTMLKNLHHFKLTCSVGFSHLLVFVFGLFIMYLSTLLVTKYGN